MFNCQELSIPFQPEMTSRLDCARYRDFSHALRVSVSVSKNLVNKIPVFVSKPLVLKKVSVSVSKILV